MKSKRKLKTRRNPVPESLRSQINKGAALYEDFTGHDAEDMGNFEMGPVPKVAVVVGELEAVIYNTVRDGIHERYIHKFKAKSRPMFAVTPDGTQLLLLGGNYDFTERGIVDA
ncbi:MAG: hypothetical protein ACYDHF_07965 [Candidatus Cryosericum sp.]